MKISQGYQILIGIGVGIVLGLFLGPICSIFKPIGDAFIMFIQMVVLPYIPCSIIHGLGSTKPSVAKQLFKKGWAFLLLLWGLVLSSIFLINQLFVIKSPYLVSTTKNSSFDRNFLKYIVPENPIYDLANNIVPAVAIFGILIGIAVMHLEHKEPLISFLERVNNTIEMILKGITKVAPIGISALFAFAVGTIEMGTLVKLSIYVLPLIALVFLFVFWALPAVLMSFTPLRYKEIIGEFKTGCMLAFMIGSPSIAIPYLNRCIKKYADKYHIHDKELHSASQTIVPISYTFTQLGSLLILFYIMFLSFYYGLPINMTERILIFLISIPMSFGGHELSLNSITFLTKELQFPSGSISIYDQTSMVTENFLVLLSVASMITFSILLLLGYYKKLRIHLGHLFKHLALFFVIVTGLIYFSKNIVRDDLSPAISSKDLSVQEIYPNDVPTTISKQTVYGMGPVDQQEDRILTNILRKRKIRVGYYPNIPPFSYFNKQGQLAGYNIAFAYKLAHDLNCSIEFIPFEFQTMQQDLQTNQFDIAMAPVQLSTNVMRDIAFTEYYLTSPVVLVVKREKQDLFTNLDEVKKNPNLSIAGFINYFKIAKESFPLAKHVEITTIEGLKKLPVEAFVWSKIEAVAFARENKNFVVVEYGQKLGNEYFSYPVKVGADHFRGFLNQWLTLQQNIGFTDKQYDYWMDGEIPQTKTPRWSIIRNVFHLN